MIKPHHRPVLPPYSWREISANPSLFYLKDHHQANAVVKRLGTGPLGFDLEWRPVFVKGQPENLVALVQLSNQDTVVLFQVSAMKEFPSELKKLLENPSIPKAGVGIQHDCKKLYKDWRIHVRHCLDLSLLARCVDNARWKGKYTQPIGLSHLLEVYKKFSLPKGKIRQSNWENELNDRQQDYAANDAHAGFVIYKHLLKLAQSLPAGKIPKKVYYSFDSIGGSLFEPSTGLSPAKPWNPHNPDYDPGPQPPPRPPKPPQFPKASHVIVTSTSASAMAARTNSPVQGPRASRIPPKPRSGDSKVHYSTSSRGGGRDRGHPLRADTDGPSQNKRFFFRYLAISK